MENNVEFLDELKAEVLYLFGEELKSSASFERFSAAIEQTTGSSLSVFTLKRLFGQMKTDGSPSINTLSILARYAGYSGWGDFVAKHRPAIKDETIAPKRRRPNYLIGAISALFVLLAAGLLIFVTGHSPKNPNEVTGTIVAKDNTLTWTLDKSTWALTITGQGKMRDFLDDKYMDEAWFAYRDSLRSVVVNEGVISIGINAFLRCKRLERVSLPASLTSIGSGAFKECVRLRDMEVPANVTTIKFDTFAHCYNLRSCVFGGNITVLDRYAFARCSSLTNIALPSSLVMIGAYCFLYCSSLEEIVIPEGVTLIREYAFRGCTALKHVSLPSSLKTIDKKVFDGCDNLVFDF